MLQFGTGEDPSPDWLSTVKVARLLGVNEAHVRHLHASGKLVHVLMTPLGRLFERKEVEALRDLRAAAKAARTR